MISVVFGQLTRSTSPRSGGPVGLAHLYVDPALAFALGWMAYYSWYLFFVYRYSAVLYCA